MVVKSKGIHPKSPKHSGLGIIQICPDILEGRFATDGSSGFFFLLTHITVTPFDFAGAV